MTDYVYDTREARETPLKITVTAGGSKTVGLHGNTQNLAIRLLPGAGTATLQSTLDDWAAIDAATAEWINSPAGAVASDTDEVLLASNVRGLKLIATTADAVFHVG